MSHKPQLFRGISEITLRQREDVLPNSGWKQEPHMEIKLTTMWSNDNNYYKSDATEPHNPLGIAPAFIKHINASFPKAAACTQKVMIVRHHHSPSWAVNHNDDPTFGFSYSPWPAYAKAGVHFGEWGSYPPLLVHASGMIDFTGMDAEELLAMLESTGKRRWLKSSTMKEYAEKYRQTISDPALTKWWGSGASGWVDTMTSYGYLGYEKAIPAKNIAQSAFRVQDYHSKNICAAWPSDDTQSMFFSIVAPGLQDPAFAGSAAFSARATGWHKDVETPDTWGNFTMDDDNNPLSGNPLQSYFKIPMFPQDVYITVIPYWIVNLPGKPPYALVDHDSVINYNIIEGGGITNKAAIKNNNPNIANSPFYGGIVWPDMLDFRLVDQNTGFPEFPILDNSKFTINDNVLTIVKDLVESAGAAAAAAEATAEALLEKAKQAHQKVLKTVHPKKPLYFSDILLSRDSHNRCRFFFGIDQRRLILDNIAFPGVIKYLESAGDWAVPQLGQIMLLIKYFSFKMKRRRVLFNPDGTLSTEDTHLTPNTPNINNSAEADFSTETLAITEEMNVKKLKDYISFPGSLGLDGFPINFTAEKGIGTDPSTTVDLGFSIQEVEGITHNPAPDAGLWGEFEPFRHFSGIDFDVARYPAGHFQYGVEIEIMDPTINFLENKIFNLSNSLRQLKDYRVYRQSIIDAKPRFAPYEGMPTGENLIVPGGTWGAVGDQWVYGLDPNDVAENAATDYKILHHCLTGQPLPVNFIEMMTTLITKEALDNISLSNVITIMEELETYAKELIRPLAIHGKRKKSLDGKIIIENMTPWADNAADRRRLIIDHWFENDTFDASEDGGYEFIQMASDNDWFEQYNHQGSAAEGTWEANAELSQGTLDRRKNHALWRCSELYYNRVTSRESTKYFTSRTVPFDWSSSWLGDGKGFDNPLTTEPTYFSPTIFKVPGKHHKRLTSPGHGPNPPLGKKEGVDHVLDILRHGLRKENTMDYTDRLQAVSWGLKPNLSFETRERKFELLSAFEDQNCTVKEEYTSEEVMMPIIGGGQDVEPSKYVADSMGNEFINETKDLIKTTGGSGIIEHQYWNYSSTTDPNFILLKLLGERIFKLSEKTILHYDIDLYYDTKGKVWSLFYKALMNLTGGIPSGPTPPADTIAAEHVSYIKNLPNQIKALLLESTNSDIINTSIHDNEINAFKLIEEFCRIYLRHFVLIKVEVFTDYEKIGDEQQVNSPLWTPLKKTHLTPSALRTKILLCRRTYYSNSEFKISQPDELQFPMYNKYFMIDIPKAGT